MTRRRSRLAVIVALIALAVAAAACGDQSTASTVGADPQGDALGAPIATPEPELPVTVRSADGRDVTVEDVSRIVPLQGNISEVVFALGLGDRVVARDVSATFEEVADLPLVTRAHDISAESVLSVKPTLVLADPDSGPSEALEHIRSVGVPVVVIDLATSVDDIDDRITQIAETLGVPEAGAALIERTEAEMDEVRALVPDDAAPLRVAFLYLRGSAGVYLIAGPDSGPDSMIAEAGAIDAGTAIGLENPFTAITSEALVKAAPDVILLTTTGLESVGGVDGLLEIPGIPQTPAGRDRRVITVEDGLLFSFGSRTPEALTQLIEQLYPA